MDIVYAERNKERTLKTVEKDLTLEEKKANVERIKKGNYASAYINWKHKYILMLTYSKMHS